MKSTLVFGAGGSLGSEIVHSLRNSGKHVLRISRKKSAEIDIAFDVKDITKGFPSIQPGQVEGIVWAQGQNLAGDALATSEESFMEILQGNVGYVHASFQALMASNLLARPCRAVVLSSVWQRLGRKQKFAYMVSKSAIGGLVRSLNIDFADQGFACNAVLPGVTDSPMTRAHLSAPELEAIEAQTPGGALITLSEVAQVVAWLLSDSSSGISGQSIVVDRGWSDAKTF